MGHVGGPPPLLQGIDTSNLLGRIIEGIYTNLWQGPPAVIVFFIVSGFCIHYPQSEKLRIDAIADYFSRRYIRIGIPLLVAIVLALLLKVNLGLFNFSIMWSLVAELIYYTIYPLLLKIRKLGFSWKRMILASFLAALLVAGTNPTAVNYPSFGPGLNWLLGLPCWLLGVLLAEMVVKDTEPRPRNIWVWRMAVWGGGTACSILAFKCSTLSFKWVINYPWTLNFFAIFVFFWLIREIRFNKTAKSNKMLEWGGTWSYSMYLTHLLAQSVWLSVPQINFGYSVNWVIHMLFILLASFIFAMLVEFPSHSLSRIIGRYFSGRQLKTAA